MSRREPPFRQLKLPEADRARTRGRGIARKNTVVPPHRSSDDGRYARGRDSRGTATKVVINHSGRLVSHHASAQVTKATTRKGDYKSGLQAKVNSKCPICDKTHWIMRCSQILILSVAQRLKTIEQKRLCRNCLSGKHFVEKCSSIHSTCPHLSFEWTLDNRASVIGSGIGCDTFVRKTGALASSGARKMLPAHYVYKWRRVQGSTQGEYSGFIDG